MKKVKISPKAIVILVLIAISILLMNTTLVVRAIDAEWWVVNISRPLRTAATTISNLVPFSLTEVFVYIVIALAIALVIAIVVLLIKRKPKTALRLLGVVLVIALLIASLYTATASAEYKRDRLTGGWADAQADKEAFLAIAQAYQKEYNRLAEQFERDVDGNIVESLTAKEVSALVYEEMSKYADGQYCSDTLAVPKIVKSSDAMSYLGISGIYLSLTGEANINTVTYYTSLPTTIAHELAHSLQIMREDEANIYAFLVCLGSQNDLLRYSALQYGYSQLLNGIIAHYSTDSEEFRTFEQGLSPLAKIDRVATSAVWAEYRGWINDVSGFFNDIYLKLSGIGKGVDSYNPGNATLVVKPPIEPGGEEIVVIEYSTIQKIFIYMAPDYFA